MVRTKEAVTVSKRGMRFETMRLLPSGCNECALKLHLSMKLLAYGHHKPTGVAINAAAVTEIM
jgi:hypothetical protein